MFNQKRNEDSFQDLQKLLATKRLELPPQSYFDGVLTEFHNRQRASLLQPRYTFVSNLLTKIEAFRELFTLHPVPRYAFAAVSAVLLLVATINYGLNPASTSSSLAIQSSNRATIHNFAFNQAPSNRGASTVDQQIDAASIEPVGLDKKSALPHYVMAQASTSYDTSMAF